MKNTKQIFHNVLTLIAACTLFFSHSRAQSPAVQWQQCFEGSDYNAPVIIIATADGGVLVAGNIYSENGKPGIDHGGYDVLIIKLNDSGTLQWQTTIGGNMDDFVYGVTQTSGSEYLLVGKTNSTTGEISSVNGMYDGWVLALTSSGKVSWSKSMGTCGNDCFNTVFECGDGNIAIAGSMSMGGTDEPGYSDFLLMKTTARGKVLWAQSFGGSGTELLTSAAQSSSGDFVLTGYASSSDGMLEGHHGKNDVWIVKTDARGIMYWQKILGKSVKGNIPSCCVTHDNGFLVSGIQAEKENKQERRHSSSKNNSCIVQLTNGGIQERQFLLSGDSTRYTGLSCFQTIEGGCVAAGILQQKRNKDKVESSQLFVMRLDTLSSIVWSRNINKLPEKSCTSFCQSMGGDMVLSSNLLGNSGDKKDRNGSHNYCVIKISSTVTIAKGKE